MIVCALREHVVSRQDTIGNSPYVLRQRRSLEWTTSSRRPLMTTPFSSIALGQFERRLKERLEQLRE